MPNDPTTPPEPSPEPASSSVDPTLPASTTPAVNSTAASIAVPPNIAAGLSVLTFGVAGVVFLVLERHNRFVRFWAMQSVFFGVAMIALGLVAGIILFVLAHLFFVLAWLAWLLFWVVRLVIVVLWIIMMIQAFTGKEWEIPVLGKMARDQLSKLGAIEPR